MILGAVGFMIVIGFLTIIALRIEDAIDDIKAVRRAVVSEMDAEDDQLHRIGDTL